MECADVVASSHFRYVTNKIVFTLQVDFEMPEATVMNSIAFASISSGLRQMKWIIWLFHRSEFRDREED